MKIMRVFVIVLLSIVGVSGLACGAPLQAYLNAGAPSPDRVWSHTDVEKFLTLLEKGTLPPPTLKDGDSGKLFMRLISPDNLIVNNSGSFEEQVKALRQILLFMQEARRVGQIYTPINAREDMNEEEAWGMNYAIRTFHKASLQMHSIEESGHPPGAQAQALVNKLEDQMNASYPSFIKYIYREQKPFSENERRILLGALNETILSYARVLSDDSIKRSLLLISNPERIEPDPENLRMLKLLQTTLTRIPKG